MIKYIGSKRVLVPAIVDLVRSLPEVRTVLDLFSGTSRVGHALKAAGFRVTANDHTRYAHTLACCYVQADRDALLPRAERLIAELDAVPGEPGWFTETYSERARFFMPHNGARIDAVREAIGRMALDPELEAVALVSLMEAADRVDSTCGLQMAYLKRWAPRAHNQLRLRVPEMLPGEGTALHLDALDAAETGEFDLVYVDPPYNQHKYLNNYHVWETLVRWDRPEVYGVVCKRAECREYRSPYNSQRGIEPALRALLGAVRARWLVVSFNDEGYVDRARMEALLGEWGRVRTHAHDFKRYVGAQIGIHDPKGRKVGAVSHLRNTEYLYVVEG